jgi:hypothetical protein
MFNQQEIDDYVKEVVNMGMLDEEIQSIQTMMADLVRYPHNTPEKQQSTSLRLSQIFKALLLAKNLRQKPVNKVGKKDGSNTENSGTSPADNS